MLYGRDILDDKSVRVLLKISVAPSEFFFISISPHEFNLPGIRTRAADYLREKAVLSQQGVRFIDTSLRENLN